MAGNNLSPFEGCREELLLLCYRMGGSLLEAEGLAEDTLLLVGGSYRAEGAPTCTELLKDAARKCAVSLADRPPRGLPRLYGAPSDPGLPPLQPREGDSWLEPFPDDLLPDPGPESGRVYGARESVSLPFIAALQMLRPRERLCLVMADTMGWETEVLAEVLGTGAGEAGRSLEAARGSMSQVYDSARGNREPPGEGRAAELLMRYLYPWETGDVAGLAGRLHEDVILQSPPSPSWYEGRDAVAKHLASRPLAGDARGRWRLLPRRANGQLAFGVYRLDEVRRIYAADSIQVLHFAGELVSEIVAFEYPWLFPTFRLLPKVDIQGRP
jgi:RNA polymerase sigma-70 factor, ECF subfamily